MSVPAVQFCDTADGVRIAYAVMGSGPPIVIPPPRFSHLGLENPMQATYEGLLQRHTLIRYDKRGTGLSERNITELTPALFQLDLEAVVAAAGLGTFSMFASSGAGAMAIDYAAAHPERVSHVVFLGTTGRTPEIPDSPAEEEIDLRRVNRRLSVKRSIELLVPDGGTRAWVERFTDFALASTEPEMSEMLARVVWHDQWRLLPQIEAEALVIHRVGDLLHSVESVREMASRLPRGQLVLLPGRDHIPTTPGQLEELLEPLLAFFPTTGAPAPAGDRAEATASSETPLSPRELEVIALIAAGSTNAEIAESLIIAPGTVGRHVTNILNKTGCRNRAEAARYAAEHGLTGA